MSNSGHWKEFKPLKELAVTFARMEDGPFGKDYSLIAFERDEEISSLIIKFDSTKELEFYFLNKILYIIIDSEPFFYTVEMFDEDLENFCNQINKDKKILIGIMGENTIEKMFLNDIIT